MLPTASDGSCGRDSVRVGNSNPLFHGLGHLGHGHQRPRELVEKLVGILLFAQRCLKEMNDRRQMQLLREVSSRTCRHRDGSRGALTELSLCSRSALIHFRRQAGTAFKARTMVKSADKPKSIHREPHQREDAGKSYFASNQWHAGSYAGHSARPALRA
jgi:hypothetical protein